ncbi:MAG: redoxin domain-containing protein [Phocaeicola sp.]|uniref:redoxin domain-containing protein n=1 Tax=Phocaeicola sp. TaxID=2773926 RepID=UPI003F9EC725
MKKLVYTMAVLSTFAFAACNNTPSYKINGSAEGIADGDTVYLQQLDGGNLIKLDSAIVTNGKFIFTGRQDTAVSRYITYVKGDKHFFDELFVENGNITAFLGEESKASGTTNNDIYQEFKDKFSSMSKELNDFYMNYKNDSTLTDTQRDSLDNITNQKDSLIYDMVYQTINKNIENPVGYLIFQRYVSAFELNQIKSLLEKIPAQYANTPTIQKMQEHVTLMNKTAVGQKYTDISMKDPDGNDISLSTYVTKNKYTLVDFWASWCGPCRQEMPNVIAAYKQFAPKGFGIVGISLDKDGDAWKKGIKDLGITWPQMSDLKYWESAGTKAYGINAIPATVLIDQQGIIVERDLRGDALTKRLGELFQ